MLGVTNLEVYNRVFNITKQNSGFINYTPGYWEDPEALTKLKDVIEKRKAIEIGLPVHEVNKRGSEVKTDELKEINYQTLMILV